MNIFRCFYFQRTCNYFSSSVLEIPAVVLCIFQLSALSMAVVRLQGNFTHVLVVGQQCVLCLGKYGRIRAVAGKKNVLFD